MQPKATTQVPRKRRSATKHPPRVPRELRKPPILHQCAVSCGRARGHCQLLPCLWCDAHRVRRHMFRRLRRSRRLPSRKPRATA
eukprot:scaffold140202_cov145-Phaeocystis_antarctica.AAC.1